MNFEGINFHSVEDLKGLALADPAFIDFK